MISTKIIFTTESVRGIRKSQNLRAEVEEREQTEICHRHRLHHYRFSPPTKRHSTSSDRCQSGLFNYDVQAGALYPRQWRNSGVVRAVCKECGRT